MNYPVSVVINLPKYAKLSGPLTYFHDESLAVGTLVRVPLGKQEVLGIVWQEDNSGRLSSTGTNQTGRSQDLNIKPITSEIVGIDPLSQDWRDLVAFAATYYQRSLGEMALQALPPQLRDLNAIQIARRLKKNTGQSKKSLIKLKDSASLTYEISDPGAEVVLTPEQKQTLGAIDSSLGPFLVYGSTGSGKTEIYLRCVASVLEREPGSQILVMVPEINLTPQLEERFKRRFAYLFKENAPVAIVSMHSGMTAAQRLQSWLAAHSGLARIILGTRMAIFASIPQLKLIVVDEEHDPSYKQQEGARYSARDLAVYRGKRLGIRVILGSATPSLESWHHAQQDSNLVAPSRYQLLKMPSRIGHALMPRVHLIDLNQQPRGTVFSVQLLDAIKLRVQRNEQVLILLNRRGYAPVLHCQDCGWKSECMHCSAYRVFHKVDRTLRCHHCGVVERVPRFCPQCGNADISPLGKGTEQMEELLGTLLSDVKQLGGEPLNILRIDADSTRLKGELSSQLARVHSGEVNILVGTQMIAKGHDFRKITLVAALYPDTALFSSDFRAPERLFSLLLQAAGRAGRDAGIATGSGSESEMWIQTQYPSHPLFQALLSYDFERFASEQLTERAQAHLPPFSFQALVRSEAKTQEEAQLFLNSAKDISSTVVSLIREKYSTSNSAWLQHEPSLFPAIAMTIQRIANIERAQMLIECDSRLMLQEFLKMWQEKLHLLQPQFKGILRWAIDVDPLTI